MKEVTIRIDNRNFRVPEDCDITFPKGCKVDISYQNNDETVLIEIKSNSGLKIATKLIETYQKILKSKLPNENEIRNFIKTRDDYAHDIRQISRYFLGKEIIVSNVNDKENKKLYDILWRRIEKVRRKINYEEHGKWIQKKQGFAKPSVYLFVKNGINREE